MTETPKNQYKNYLRIYFHFSSTHFFSEDYIKNFQSEPFLDKFMGFLIGR